MIVADYIALFLADKGIKHVFSIVGAGNVAIFEAIRKLDKTQIICVHHEQAAVMAAGGYYRIKQIPGVALLTTGAGSSNAITGVLAAYMDSIPILVRSGNEPSDCFGDRTRGDRILGVQGYNSAGVASSMVKWAGRIGDPLDTIAFLTEGWRMLISSRMGPIWMDIPRNIQNELI